MSIAWIVNGFLYVLAGWFLLNGILGMAYKLRNGSYIGLGLLSLFSGVTVLILDCVLNGGIATGHSLMATLFFTAAVCNTLAASILQRTLLLSGFDKGCLLRFVRDWRKARINGSEALFLQGMDHSDYLRFVSDALRIVHDVAISVPRNYTIEVCDYGFLVDACSLTDKSRYRILVAYPTVPKEKLKNLKLVDGNRSHRIYVISSDFGICVKELLDDLSSRLINEKNYVTSK